MRNASLILLIIVLGLANVETVPVWAGINEWSSLGRPEGGPVGLLIIDPRDPNTLYATNAGDATHRAAGIFKSTNGGAAWHAVSVGLTTTAVFTLALDPQDPGTLFAGSWGRGVFKSTDAGESWAATGLTDTYISALAIDPQNRSTMYAFAGNNTPEGLGIYKSTDGATSWVNLGPPGYLAWSIQVLAIDPRDSSTLYAGDGGCCSNGGLYKSADGGITWIEAPAMRYCNIVAILFTPLDSGTLYAGGSCGDGLTGNVFKTTDAGTTWIAVNAGLPEGQSNVWALVFDPDHPQIMYAGFSRVGVFRSVDGGASWSAFNNGLQNLVVQNLALTRGTRNDLYAVTPNGVFKITDNSPLATNATLNPTSVRRGSSFTAILAGKNLTDETYFDVRFLSPGNNTEQESLNWQQGLSAIHGVATAAAAGTWTITGTRAHQDVDDHQAAYLLVSATVTLNPLLVTDVRFDPASVRPGGSSTATFSGTNLTSETYFDIRFRSPGSNTDQVALNWQKGTSAGHSVPAGTAVGTWTVTGIWAHENAANHSSDFVPVSAILVVIP